jgi:hypothetical protein
VTSRKLLEAERASATAIVGVESAAVQTLDAELAELDRLDIDGLRLLWRKLFRKPALSHLPRYLLVRIIAYRLQANVYGDLDRETVKYLDRVAREWQARHASGTPRSPTAILPPPKPRPLKAGTLLEREHGGRMHQVVVMNNDFSWNETTYRSLSEVARAITGTNWNGPRFFGLRDKADAQVAVEKRKRSGR